jgi:murein DD-endopeptidase MepM/ murein hydrolase activator NlpD
MQRTLRRATIFIPMTKRIFGSVACLTLITLCISLLVPANATLQAQVPQGEVLLASHNDDEDDDGSTRYSSSVRRKINVLDEDIVDRLFIPILFGVSVRQLTPNFGDPRDGGARSHEGLDILAPLGTPIVSPTDAVVTGIGTFSGAGKYVRTANPGGERFYYYHLSDFAEDLDTGDELESGDLIGYVGDTGNAQGGPAHLHFEIREDRDIKDPFERIVLDLELADKIEYLAPILRNTDDEEEFAEFLVEEFSAEFRQALQQGIELPDPIAELISPARFASVAAPSRDLEIGDEGPDVSALQSRLIAEGYLEIAAPTGYFGPQTQAAVRAYQIANGISPSTGNYGPLTRTHMTGSSAPAPAVTGELSLATIVELFITLGIIPDDKADAARQALASMSEG